MTEPKTQLDAREIVMSYVLNRLHSVEQHIIAITFGINSGRVSEAITAIEYAVKNIKDIYLLATGRAKIEHL